MIRLAIIVIFVSLIASSVLAGTWRDDFEKGFVGWEGLDDCWKVENGECSGEYWNAPESMFELIWPGKIWAKDYILNFKMKFVGNLGGCAGTNFRHTQQDRYGFGIMTDTNIVKGWKFFQGVVTELSKEPLLFIPFKDIWYELKVIAKGDHYEFYIDEELASEFKDKSIPSGWVVFIYY